jgi:hypothetical protein
VPVRRLLALPALRPAAQGAGQRKCPVIPEENHRAGVLRQVLHWSARLLPRDRHVTTAGYENHWKTRGCCVVVTPIYRLDNYFKYNNSEPETPPVV